MGYSPLQPVRGLGYTVGVELHQLKQVDQHHTHQGFVIAQIFSLLDIIYQLDYSLLTLEGRR